MTAPKESLIIPTIHLNGTSRERLEEALETAYNAVNAAIAAVAETAPNGRDYYPQGPHAIFTAIGQHMGRMQKLQDVKIELGEIAEAIAFK